MKKLNAKRIAAVAAGAALLGIGFAFGATPTGVSFSNIPIINSNGQPQVTIVVGSKAQISDGIAAANIAAAIGNLAYSSQGITARVVNNSTNQAKLHVVVSGSGTTGTTATSASVYLNETGTAYASGSYNFQALIGSILNKGIQLGSWQYTKAAQTASSGYAYQETTLITGSPATSPYYNTEDVPGGYVSANNAGGLSFGVNPFNDGTTGDNILQVTNTNLPSLANGNLGAYHEAEYLWLTGLPVYDQNTNTENYVVADAGGAYQAVFNKPIPEWTSNTINNAQIELLGQNWTILNYQAPGQGAFTSTAKATGSATSGTSTATLHGGKLELASSLSALETVYVGQNITSGLFKVELADIGQPNSAGTSPAGIDVFYNGGSTPTNVTSIYPGNTVQFNVSGTNLYVKVNSTFAGLYAYQKYAKIQLYSNVYNVTDGKVWNQTNDPGWYTTLLWTNSSTGPDNELQSIIIYNTSGSTTLTPGQSFPFITKPTAWTVQFYGDENFNNFDALQVSVSTEQNINYENYPGSTGAGITSLDINNITEPAQLLKVHSSIPNAFTSQVSSDGQTVLVNLASDQLVEDGNTVTLGGSASGNAVTYSYNDPLQLATSSNPIVVTVKGYTSNTASAPTTVNAITLSTSATTGTGSVGNVFNVTSITLSTVAPGLSFNVLYGGSTVAALVPDSPQILFSVSNKGYSYQNYTDISGSPAYISWSYNQNNGQPTTDFYLTKNAITGTPNYWRRYYTFNITEEPVPSNTAALDSLEIGIYNSTAGAVGNPFFQLNQSASGTHNNMTYLSTQAATAGAVQAIQGFRTERGSKVAQISPSTDTIDLAEGQDWLYFDVVPSTSSGATSTTHTYGPFGIGNKITGVPGVNPNVSIGKVTNVTLGLGSSTSYTITGIQNLTAVPSATQAIVPTPLLNITTTPLVVLDSQANPSSALILIGSGYVNTLSQQVVPWSNYTSSTSILAAYGNKILIAGYSAAQTTQEANAFIQALYKNAGYP